MTALARVRRKLYRALRLTGVPPAKARARVRAAEREGRRGAAVVSAHDAIRARAAEADLRKARTYLRNGIGKHPELKQLLAPLLSDLGALLVRFKGVRRAAGL